MRAKNIYEVFTKQPVVFKKYEVQLAGVTYKGFQPQADAPVQFRGLPFGGEISGKYRFQYAKLFNTSAKEIDCTQYGPACWQNPVGIRMIYEGLGVLLKEGIFPSTKKGKSLVYGNFNEECLNLNIYTPSLEPKKRPVMVWIHGGAFKSGSNIECGLYNGSHLAQRGDAVVVCINYRFGMFAFNFPDENITNIALSDQVLALQWVQQNIAHFGGDADNVTIFGESAGAISVASLLGSPMAKGLFHKAISQSGGAESMTPNEFNLVAEAATKSFSKYNNNQALRTTHLLAVKPTVLVDRGGKIEETLEKKGSGKIGFMPLRDGKYISAEGTLKAIELGESANIPLLVGSNAEEMQLFFALLGVMAPFNEKTVISAIRQRLDLIETEETEAVHQKLKEISRQLMFLSEKKLEKLLGKAPKKNQILEACLTFLQFTVPAIELAEAHQSGGGDVYSYMLRFGSGKYGACHGIDLQLLWNFGHPNEGYFCNGKNKVISTDPKQPALAHFAESMQDAWIHFARHGKPSSFENQEWKAFPARMDLDINSTATNWQNDEMIDFWKTVRRINKSL